MYGLVLATALTSGTTAADWGWRHKCHCSCSCWCSCSCSCYGCYGCYGCKGCWGGCYCGGCHGCWTSCGCYGCYGYCGGWGCCSCSCSVSYGCHGCYGCYGGCAVISYGCSVGCAAPVISSGYIDGGVIISGEVSANRPATVVVKASRDVQIKVNGQVTPRKTEEESYQSPALVPGRTYSYTVVAELTRDGKKHTETKEITVQAGRRSEVDFSTLGTTAVAKTESDAAPASVTVVLPDDAKLTVNDVAVTAKGRQTFQTPKLEKGKSYFYTVKAEIVRDGKPVTETRRIDIAAGKEVTVDFTTPTLTASR